mmetsp:Transcript_28617/g.34855  ORF Transcript_28617/g.34855 Transcript_28617/m.34855 type:complete len:223 (+) Transcript_28617:55-723(+)|eukprot:CAMPEP_0172507710 /NCGR_PEP_ID=MMETSP1066-20121228/205888_1 /TAXON_ID=671091 /ORGANISM="Coscinodiscus wailesii, Strain CCMP2513" /LENGTH=222 /DNA_ID=CAMNT_0013285361 /DNA_START=54 /DNA_END=722 /DNA_ORIENTATION=+
MSLLVEPNIEDENESKHEHPLTRIWKKYFFLSIVLPLIIRCFFGFFFGDDNEDQDLNDGGLQATIYFTYLCSMLLFIVIYLNGIAFFSGSFGERRWFWYIDTQVADNDGKSAKNLGLMAGALVVFSCYSFLFFLVTFVLLMDFEEIDELMVSLGSWASIIPITFLFWSILCGWFSRQLYYLDSIDCDTGEDNKNGSNDKEVSKTPSTELVVIPKDPKKEPLV